jgi:rfaE bifunctional protein nucleotidyltransferase chain/domain/rfaE bifunctional protein kinase chain/domain
MTRVVVIGDVMLDRDVVGTVSRVCPDAPVPVLDVKTSLARPGGAALAATIATGYGASVTLICALASDGPADELKDLLGGIDVDVCAYADDGTTAEKIRLRALGHSLARVDRGFAGSIGDPPPTAGAALARADAVLVADYGRGVTRVPSMRALVEQCVAAHTPVVWDPHPRGATPTDGVSLCTPNKAEATWFAPQIGGDSLTADLSRARHLRQLWRTGAVAVTRGAEGALLVTGVDAPIVVPAVDASPDADACGAGDAFAAAATVALAGRVVMSEAVESAVAAAGHFIRSGGVSRLDTRQPVESWTVTAAHEVSARSRCKPTVVATGGCFDVLHAGHVQTLMRARALGDRLVVLLNSDASVRRLKGPGRPVQHQNDRVTVLRSLRCVDEVIVFDEDTPTAVLEMVRPDVFVKGGDYVGADLPERAVMDKWNGAVVTVPYLTGRSTTSILDRPIDRPRGDGHVE